MKSFLCYYFFILTCVYHVKKSNVFDKNIIKFPHNLTRKFQFNTLFYNKLNLFQSNTFLYKSTRSIYEYHRQIFIIQYKYIRNICNPLSVY